MGRPGLEPGTNALTKRSFRSAILLSRGRVEKREAVHDESTHCYPRARVNGTLGFGTSDQVKDAEQASRRRFRVTFVRMP